MNETGDRRFEGGGKKLAPLPEPLIGLTVVEIRRLLAIALRAASEVDRRRGVSLHWA